VLRADSGFCLSKALVMSRGFLINNEEWEMKNVVYFLRTSEPRIDRV
jgi:hypothetical protein